MSKKSETDSNGLPSFLNFAQPLGVKFDDSKSKIIFGPNGTGKSKTFNALKEHFQADWDYISYEQDLAAIDKSGSTVSLSLNSIAIEKAGDDLDKAFDHIDFKSKEKEFGIGTKSTLADIGLGELYNFQTDPQKIRKILVTREDAKLLESTLKDSHIKFEDFCKSYTKLLDCANIDEQITMLKDNYLDTVLPLIAANTNSETSCCPVCHTPMKSEHLLAEIRKTIEKRQKVEKSVFTGLLPADLDEEKGEKTLKQLIAFVSKYKVEGLEDEILFEAESSNYDQANQAVAECLNARNALKELIDQRTDFYNRLVQNIDHFQNNLRCIDESIQVREEPSEKTIVISLGGRKANTFSTGERDFICFQSKMIMCEDSDKQYLLVDDPASSFDLVNEYRIAFDLCLAASKKPVLVFTHNIDFANSIFLQSKGRFDYYYMEREPDGRGSFLTLIKKVNSEIRFSPLFSLDGIKEKNPYIRDLELRDTLDKENPDFRSVSSIFHYDGYKAKYQNESNEYLFNLIDEYQPGSLKMESFEQITIQKILYLSALRVWIEKVLFEKLIQGHPERESEWKSEKKQQFGSRIEYVTEGQCKDDFHRCFPNVTRGSLMMKKTMINQDEHPGSRVAAFGYAMNISLFDLDKEIVDIKSLMEG